jgi:hypothetical protein
MMLVYLFNPSTLVGQHCSTRPRYVNRNQSIQDVKLLELGWSPTILAYRVSDERLARIMGNGSVSGVRHFFAWLA